MDITNDTVNSIVYTTKVFVGVRWPWVILPDFLLVVGSDFLTITMTMSRKSSISLWKSAALAPYYHGLEGPKNDEDDDLALASRMEKKAEGQKVRLQNPENSNRLVLRQERVSTPVERMILPT